MSLIAARSDGPTRIIPIDGRPVTVKSLGTSPVFFGTEQGVSSALKTGELAQNASTEVTQPTYFLVEPPARVGTSLLGTRQQVLEVTQTGTQLSRLPAGSVSNPDLASSLGEGAFVQSPALPAAGAEKSVVVGSGQIARKVTAVHVGDGAETKIKVKHGFNTFAVDVIVQKGAETKKPGEGYLNAAGAGNFTWTTLNANEIEITFGTAPIAKFESFITVEG